MKKNKKDEGGLWTAKFSEVVASLQVLEKNGFTREMLDCLRGPDGNNIAQEIIAQFYDPALNSAFYRDTLEEWEIFYKKYFDVPVNLSKISIPRIRKEFDRLLIIIPGIPVLRIISIMDSKFRIAVESSDYSLYKTIDERRDAGNPYAIWVRDGEEPETDFLSRSAEWMYNCPKASETLKERLIHGLKYWDENKKHLDVDVATLCSGSKNSHGTTPIVSFSCLSSPEKNTVKIAWIKSSDSFRKVGAREVISWDI